MVAKAIAHRAKISFAKRRDLFPRLLVGEEPLSLELREPSPQVSGAPSVATPPAHAEPRRGLSSRELKLRFPEHFDVTNNSAKRTMEAERAHCLAIFRVSRGIGAAGEQAFPQLLKRKVAGSQSAIAKP